LKAVTLEGVAVLGARRGSFPLAPWARWGLRWGFGTRRRLYEAPGECMRRRGNATDGCRGARAGAWLGGGLAAFRACGECEMQVQVASVDGHHEARSVVTNCAFHRISAVCDAHQHPSYSRKPQQTSRRVIAATWAIASGRLTCKRWIAFDVMLHTSRPFAVLFDHLPQAHKGVRLG
jgi:hypothetical protein